MERLEKTFISLLFKYFFIASFVVCISLFQISLSVSHTHESLPVPVEPTELKINQNNLPQPVKQR